MHLAPRVHCTDLIRDRLPLLGWARFDQFACRFKILALQDLRVSDFHHRHYYHRLFRSCGLRSSRY